MFFLSPQELSPAANRLLQELLLLEADDEADPAIVCEGLECWIDDRRTSWRTVRQLLQAVLISDTSWGDACRRYELNESGRRYLQGLPPYCDSQGQFHATMFDLLAKAQDH